MILFIIDPCTADTYLLIRLHSLLIVDTIVDHIAHSSQLLLIIDCYNLSLILLTIAYCTVQVDDNVLTMFGSLRMRHPQTQTGMSLTNWHIPVSLPIGKGKGKGPALTSVQWNL